jgi:hypothetical protein
MSADGPRGVVDAFCAGAPSAGDCAAHGMEGEQLIATMKTACEMRMGCAFLPTRMERQMACSKDFWRTP